MKQSKNYTYELISFIFFIFFLVFSGIYFVDRQEVIHSHDINDRALFELKIINNNIEKFIAQRSGDHSYDFIVENSKNARELLDNFQHSSKDSFLLEQENNRVFNEINKKIEIQKHLLLEYARYNSTLNNSIHYLPNFFEEINNKLQNEVLKEKTLVIYNEVMKFIFSPKQYSNNLVENIDIFHNYLRKQTDLRGNLRYDLNVFVKHMKIIQQSIQNIKRIEQEVQNLEINSVLESFHKKNEAYFLELTRKVTYLVSGLYILLIILSFLMMMFFIRLIRSRNKISKFNEELEEKVKVRTEELHIAKEKAEEAGFLKEEFLANMSHEIRTPMNAVLGFTDLLIEDVKVPKQLGYLKSIKRSGKQLLEIINDILEISKIQAGKMEINLTPVNPYVLFKDLHSIFKTKIESKNLEFIFEIDKELPKSILIDEVRIRQILFNLIGNAVKFTENGFIKVSTSKVYKDDERSHLDMIIKIQDSGIGIAKEQQKGIFDPFIQTKNQSVKKYGGTGLGLSISSKLAKLMGGKLFLESEEGKGSTFTIFLEDVSVSSAIAEKEDIFEHEKLKQYKFEYAKIIVVDDIEVNRILVKDYLALYDFEVIEASNGAEAVRLANANTALILMDIKMPVMNGYEATKRIKENPETAHVPVFALTASVLQNENNREKNAIFDNFLSKPIDKSTLIKELATVLPHTLEKIEEASTPEIEEQTIEQELSSEAKEKVNDFLPSLDEAEKKGDLDIIATVANELLEFAKENNQELLEKKVTELITFTENFDIENIMLTIQDLKLILEKIK